MQAKTTSSTDSNVAAANGGYRTLFVPLPVYLLDKYANTHTHTHLLRSLRATAALLLAASTQPRWHLTVIINVGGCQSGTAPGFFCPEACGDRQTTVDWRRVELLSAYSGLSESNVPRVQTKYSPTKHLVRL